MSNPPRSIPEWTLPRELVALNHMVTEMSTLAADERRRVLSYLNDRYGQLNQQEEPSDQSVRTTAEPGPPTGTATDPGW